MRVALVHDHLNQIGGAERVLKALADLFPDAPIYTAVYDERTVGSMFPKSRIRATWLQRFPLAKRHTQFYILAIPHAFQALDLSDYDLVITDTSALAKGVKVNPHAVHLCYCHTPTRYLWRRTPEEYIHPLQRLPLVGTAINYLVDLYKPWDFHAAQAVTQFIANSKFIAGEIAKHYKREAIVVPPPVEIEQFTPSPLPDKQEGYFLILSRLRPYKKVDLAIQAFNRLNFPLVIAGEGQDRKRLERMAKANIKFVGAVSDQERNKLFQGACAFIHPQQEDWGITAVEAMAAGRPVIAYKAGGAMETVIPGVTGELFEEQSWQDLADMIIRFDPSRYDPFQIAKHASQFSPLRFQERIKEIVESYGNRN
ncbi:MAG: glycosyltransferase [bacterium]